MAALAVVGWAATQTSGEVLVASCILGWALLTVAVIDWRSYLVPERLSLFFMLTGFAAAFALDPTHLWTTSLAQARELFPVRSVGVGLPAIRGREGLGFGDAKLLGGLGSWVDVAGTAQCHFVWRFARPLAVLVKSQMGKRLKATDRIPFGTFLAAAGWLVWLYGPLSFS